MKSRALALTVFVFLVPATVAAQTADDFFSPDVVHRIDLLIHSRDWEKLKANFQSNDYYPADVKWNGTTVRNVGIRSRGLASRSAEKPALRVDMNRYTSGQKFLGLKSFLLDNLVQDPSGLRERVAMRLYERMGLPAPRETHAALYINNTYAGLYGVVESIDKDFLARVFGERNGNTENDGYLFEHDWVEPWRWNYLGPNLNAYAIRFDPTTHENASMVELYGPIEAMVRAINEAPEASYIDAVSPYLDLPLLMRHLAVQNFIAEDDGILGGHGTANFHLYRFENTTRSQFIPWDEDRAFERVDRSIVAHHDDYVLMRRAMRVPALRAAYFNALLEIADSVMEPVSPQGQAGPGWLEQEFRTYRALVTPMMRADPLKPYSNADFEATMDALIAFPPQRVAFVRCAVARATGVNQQSACGS